MSLPPAFPLVVEARRHHTGIIVVGSRHGEWSAPLRWIIHGESGALIAPVASPIEPEASVVVGMPDESAASLHVLVSPSPIDDWRSSEACDRWMAYHRRPDGPRWYTLAPVSLRLDQTVADTAEAPLTNALRAVEPALCREINANSAQIARIVENRTGQPSPPSVPPVCVGVDPLGIDIRTHTGVLRVDFQHLASDPDAARAQIARLGGRP